ncbi:hypothetical protein D3C80_1726850 [compost metagenome]
MGRHRQAEGGGGVLGVRAQLADQLLAGVFHARDETAGEGHHQEQADGEKQLLEQGHGVLLAFADGEALCTHLFQ